MTGEQRGRGKTACGGADVTASGTWASDSGSGASATPVGQARGQRMRRGRGSLTAPAAATVPPASRRIKGPRAADSSRPLGPLSVPHDLIRRSVTLMGFCR